jgi:hypothetical protein
MSRAVFQSTLGGSTTLDAEQTADTKTLVIPAADGTLVYTDDAGVASFDDISLTGAVIAGAWDGDTIDVAHGGTGAVTLTGYVKGAGTTAMTASATIPNSDITGLGTMSTQNASSVAITGGTISGLGTPLAVPSGGSGAATLTGYVIGNGTSAMTASATIPNTDITGLGTMSTQDANAVAITGGTISGLGTALAVPSGGTGATTLTGYVKGAGTSAMTASATIPNTDVTGLGTMSTQSSDAVTITGGTANGLTIGGSTPAAVTATTLRVNSTVSLAGNTGTAGQVLTSNGGSAPTWESIAGVGTVTSVDGSGGTTGLSLSGGPITASGTLTLGGTLAVANGGTGSTTAGDALTALGAYPASNPSGFTSNTGTVTDVTGTAPVVSSGGTTPAISMAAATTSVDGYLSSTDWNTFNGKGTVSSVSGTGTVNGLSLSGTVTTTGNLTLGGTLDLASPPAIGGTTPAAGAFTTLSMNGGALSPQTGFRNRIINGGMTIDQRNAGASVTNPGTSAVAYTLDRWAVRNATDAAVNVIQSTDAPTADFSYSIELDVTTADTSIAAGQVYTLQQRVEGFNVVDLGFGKAGTRYFTVSFWHKHTKTGTYCAGFTNSAGNRAYPAEYTQAVADTWEQSFVTVPVDTTGTWLSTNGVGLLVYFVVAAGSDFQGTVNAWSAANTFATANQVNALDSTSNFFRITGVQLEKGSVATPFEFRSIGTELALCQRYYYKIKGSDTASNTGTYSTGFSQTTTAGRALFTFPVPMRTFPSALEQSGTASDYRVILGSSGSTTCSAVPTYTSSSILIGDISWTVASGATANQGVFFASNSANSYLGWSAEL